jgi:ABC-type Fe3+-hydroxamate transport system substrate-binding protein
MKVTCAPLGSTLELAERPERVVSLSSGLTEALFEMGCGDRVAGVSTYCSRYIADLKATVVGDYLRVDEEELAACAPDLILSTTGVQLSLARRLAQRGLPVYARPLPGSLYGVLENIVTLGALLDDMEAARALTARMTAQAVEMSARHPGRRPRVYVELWFGKHMRSIGGRTFIHDLVTIAGGEPVFGASREAYPRPDLSKVPGLRPDIAVFFQEPEYPIDVPALLDERGWDNLFGDRVIASTVQRGKNLIHDGPSLLETAHWLHDEIRRCLDR